MSQPSNGISRRAVARGAAWGVPVVVVAAAAPAHAASFPLPLYAARTSQNSQWTIAGTGPGGTWIVGSSIQFRMRNSPTVGFWRFRVASNTAGTFDLNSFAEEITTPWPVSWTSSPAGWQVTNLTPASTSTSTYRFAPITFPVTHNIGTPYSISAACSTGINAPSDFIGTVSAATAVAAGWAVYGQPLGARVQSFPLSWTTTYTVKFPTYPNYTDTYGRSVITTLSYP